MRADGFTLIELLVVLTIMALLTSLAAPLLNRALPGLEIRSAARAFADDLKVARDRALRTKRSSFVEIDVDQRNYRQGEDGPLIEFPDGSNVTLTVADRERVDDSRGRIRFFPDGTATGGKVVIQRGKNAIALEVDWFDGRTRQIDGAQ
jgi:general secretion pathway protein H